MAEADRSERRTHEERRDEAERKLFKAAVTLLAERGLERLTLSEVGEAAGYSRGQPAHYFGNKSGLVVALAEHLVGEFNANLARVETHSPGLERLLGTVRYYFDVAIRDPLAARAISLLFSDGLSNPLIKESIAEVSERSIAGIAANLTAAILKQEVRVDLDPKTEAVLIMGALRGAVALWLLSPDIDLVQVREAMTASLQRSLAP